MTALPDASRAAVARVLADLEIAVSEASREPARMEVYNSQLYYYGQTNVDAIRAAALVALHAIVDVVLDLDLTAADRQQWVTFYQEHILTTYAIDRAPFLAAARAQSWWLRFQQILRGAERTDIPPLFQQLRALRAEARWTEAQLAEAAELTTRAVQRHLSDHHPQIPKGPTLASYERAFQAKLNRPITLTLPPPSKRRRRPRQRVAKKS